MAHWHNYNPWADRIFYTASLDEWLNCLANKFSRAHYRKLAEYHRYKIDCYILPGPTYCSIGMRYGRLPEYYYSPQGDEAECRKIVAKYMPKPRVCIRQFDAKGTGLDCSWWIAPNDYSLHVLTYDVLIKGCVRVEYD